MNVKVLTHSGKEFELYDALYDAAAINEQLNNSDIFTVLIGGVIFSRIDIKRVETVNTPS